MESLKSRILNYFERYDIQNPGVWQNGGEIERLAMDIGYKASNSSRRCRELVKDGYLERRENKNGSVEYRIKQKEPLIQPTHSWNQPVLNV
jgi:DNA-binding MarR family transcriptional regulator